MIRLAVPSLPPSSNNAYINLPSRKKGKVVIPGGRTLTEEGRAYKKETTSHLVRTYPHELAKVRKDVALFVYVRFYFPTLENKGWPKSAESRYKRIDVSNRLKLFEDALKDACGIDDAQHELIFLEKRVGSAMTEVFIWDLEREEPPLEPLTSL